MPCLADPNIHSASILSDSSTGKFGSRPMPSKIARHHEVFGICSSFDRRPGLDSSRSVSFLAFFPSSPIAYRHRGTHAHLSWWCRRRRYTPPPARLRRRWSTTPGSQTSCGPLPPRPVAWPPLSTPQSRPIPAGIEAARRDDELGDTRPIPSNPSAVPIRFLNWGLSLPP